MADDLIPPLPGPNLGPLTPPPETPAPPMPEPTEFVRPAEAGESSDAAEAKGARETMERLPRQRVKPATPAPAKKIPETPVEVDNPYERHLGGPEDDGPADLERARLNMVNSYYRGSAAGATGLYLMAKTYTEQDPPDMDPAMKEARQKQRDEYENIVLDLMRYDMMPSWSGLPQLGAAIGGTVAGAAMSPESFLGWASQGATWVARTVKAGLQQGLISGIADPAIQGLNMNSGVQEEYDWGQTVGAIGFGTFLGGGFHAAGEGAGHLIGQRELRKQLSEISDVYNDLMSVEMGLWGMDPRNGIKTVRVPLPEERFAPKPVTPEEERAARVAAIQQAEDRRKAFTEEVTPEQFDQFVKEYVPDDPTQAMDLPYFYERKDGETVEQALGRAMDDWADARMRAALAHETDEHMDAALDVFLAAYDADRETFFGSGGHSNLVNGRYEIGAAPLSRGQTFPDRGARLVPTTTAQEIPFESTSIRETQDGAGAARGGGEAPGEKPGASGRGDSAGGRGDASGEGRRAADIPGLERYAQSVIGPDVRSVTLIGSQAEAGRGRDIDLLYDLGARELPNDKIAAAEAVSGIIERQPNLDIDAHDSFFKVGDRYFHVSSGAGRAVVENTDYAAQQAGRPQRALAAEAPRGERVVDRKPLVEERKKLLSETKVFADKGDLTRQEAATFQEKRRQIAELDYQLALPADATKVAAPKDAKSALAPETVVSIYDDTIRSKPVFMAVREAADGVFFSADTAVDQIMAGKNADVSARQFYDTFNNTRAALRKQFGDTLTLYRSEGQQKAKATQNWATTREFAEQFGGNIKTAEVPVDNVVGAFVNRNGRYHELIVGEPPERVLSTERTAQGEQTLIPGVEPITDRERVQAGTEKPLEGGTTEMPKGGLFDTDVQAQTDLLDIQALRGNRANNPMPGEERRDSQMGIAAAGLSDDQVVKIQSLHQLAVALAEKLDIPLRQGRMNLPGVTKDTLGIYKTRSGVVRLREIADWEVAKHEVGHAIEAKVGPELTALTQKYRYEMAPLDYDQGPTGQRPNEGFAEWMRIRMTNPAGARRLAPNFANEFDALLARERPDILQIVNDAAIAHRRFLDATSQEVGAAVVQNTIEGNRGFLKVVKDGADIVREVQDEGLPQVTNTYLTKMWQWMQRRYDNFFDRFQDMERATRELLAERQKQQGGGIVQFTASDDPSILIRSARRAGQGAYTQIMFGIVPYRQVSPVGPSLKDVFNTALGKPFLGSWKDETIQKFDQYVTARMSVYLWERYDQGLIPNEPSPIKPGDARQIVSELEQAFPNFRRAGDMLNDMHKQVRQKKLDAGLWSKEVYDATMAYDFYVPMKRVMEDGPGMGHNGGPSMAGDSLASAVKKRVGSERDIDSPLRNVMRDIFFMEQDIRRNEIRGALANLAESVAGDGGKFMERLPRHQAKQYTARLDEMIKAKAKEIGMDPKEAQTMIDTLLNGEEGPLVGQFWKMEQAAANGEPVVFHWKNGEPVPYRVMSRPGDTADAYAQGRYRLFQLMTEAPAPLLDMWSNIVSLGAGTLRAGVTNNPAFIITNYIKDQLQVFLSQPGYIPFFGGMKGIVQEAAQGQTARMRAGGGGVMGGSLVGEIEHRFEADLRDMAKQGYLIKRVTSVKGLFELMQITEAGTRNSIFDIVYQQKLKQGLSPFEALDEAVHRSNDIMDFSRHGDRMEWIRRNITFFNAAIQGGERYLYRGLLEPFLRPALTVSDQEARSRAAYSWMVTAGGGIVAGMGWAALNWEKESYRDARPDVKGTNVLLPLPNGGLAVLPKPFELGFGFTMGEYAYAHLFEKDPRAAAQLAEALRQSVAPPNPITQMPGVSTAIELKTNYSFFREGPIVPDRLANPQHPELEYDERTSPIAKYLGQKLGWSPIKVDYAIGALFGTNGRDLMSATSMIDRDTPATALDDTVIIRRFLKNDERISGRTKQFWQYMGAKNGQYAADAEAYSRLVKDGHLRGVPSQEAADLLNKLSTPERVYVVMQEGANDRGKQAFTADDRRLHPLNRAYDAVTVLNGVVRDLNNNTLVPYREKERLQLSPEQRRMLIDDIKTLAGAEMRNAFAIVGEPGYQGRQVFDVDDYMALIRKVSPAVADEISTRYATGKVLTTRAVQEAWPELSREIVRYGTDANIRGMAARARAEGTEFGGAKVKKPVPFRAPIPGAAPPP